MPSLLAFVLLLQGCGGGGGEEGDDDDTPDPVETGPAEVEGIWRGSVSRTPNGAAKPAVLFADRAGDALLYVSDGADSFVLRGDACCDANVEGDAQAWTLFAKVATAAPIRALVTNLVSGGRSISGDLTLDGVPYSLSLTFDSRYNQPTTLQSIAGVYTRTMASGTTYTFAVSDSGEIDGSDTIGCVYQGRLSVPDATRNLFRIPDLQMSFCPAQAQIRNGSYTGYGDLEDQSADSPNRILSFVLTGPVAFPPVLPVK